MKNCGVQHKTIHATEEATPQNHQPSMDAPSRDVPLTEQPVWEVEMVMEGQQDSTGAAFHSVRESTSEEDADDLRQGRDEEEGGQRGKSLGGDEMEPLLDGYECITVTESLSDKLEKTEEDSALSQSLTDSVGPDSHPEPAVPPPMQVSEQGELFNPQTLQTVVTSCDISGQRTALEGSQVVKSAICRGFSEGFSVFISFSVKRK